jgi:acyl-CoA reductase-like NAD-dependent aldehyde dehydrogenase
MTLDTKIFKEGIFDPVGAVIEFKDAKEGPPFLGR